MTDDPMLASPSDNTEAGFRRLMESGDWIADVKMDGVRCWARWDGVTVTLTNRRHVNITAKYPEVVTELVAALADRSPVLLDGEIVAADGLFESALTRDKQSNPARILAMSVSRPCVFFAFDVPDVPGSYLDRRLALELLVIRQTVLSESPEFFAQTRELGLEGVIAKRRNGRYESGKRSKNWVKYKHLSRVSCLVAGYTAGTGSRVHFGAMQLAMLDEDGNPVGVGRVGTGFDAKEILRLKTALDAGELLVVEVECANRTSGGQLRFPSYKGVRLDVAPTDCTIHQLDLLTAC